MNKLKFAALFLYGLFCYAAVTHEEIKVYLIISTRSGEYTIEKIYLKKDNAQKYCDQFKDSHNYAIEERKLIE